VSARSDPPESSGLRGFLMKSLAALILFGFFAGWLTAIAAVIELSKLERAYAAFNARDIDAALATMHAEVDWPNGMEGGRVHGHAAVRDYWTRQWGIIDPRVEPLSFATDAAGRTVVAVHQVVRDLAGKVLSDTMVRHVYSIDGGFISLMDIDKS
jgi:hypothetical protein